MKKQKGIIEYYSIDVYSRTNGIETIKVYGYEADNKAEARKQASQYGKVINITVIYQHD